ncbi:hypothetical protein BABINDRAFT_159266 [Babjeviella inositovora NRRL Y-12698]|uniref:Uncharacterized protein n=1 Tax=Babjeviella inositovora NRRL Y-12698 TaxID=984486 RepID=A0A1E3QYJ6_9ASCO|nr:uncharacterized protein BABINDRAFT_159266 [Babjeviella inositovora NRRL Y-12698]ODQ82750.1 hypothetical protein BABINDRAFT_159266 [Babjeviella inositovora NRRL Y-12698]
MTPHPTLNPPLPISAAYRKGSNILIESPVISSFKRKFSDLHVGPSNHLSLSRPMTPIDQTGQAQFSFGDDYTGAATPNESYFPVSKKFLQKNSHDYFSANPVGNSGVPGTPAFEESRCMPPLLRNDSSLSVSSLIADFPMQDRNCSVVDYTVTFSAKFDRVLMRDYEQIINDPQSTPFHGKIPPSGLVSGLTKRVLAQLIPSTPDNQSDALEEFRGYFTSANSPDIIMELFENKPLLLALIRKRLLDTCTGQSLDSTMIQMPGPSSSASRFSGLSDPLHSLSLLRLNSLSRNSSFSGVGNLGRQHSNSSWLHVGNFGKLQATAHNNWSSESIGGPPPLRRSRNDSLASVSSFNGLLKDPLFPPQLFFATPPASIKSLMDLTGSYEPDVFSRNQVFDLGLEEELDFSASSPVFAPRPVTEETQPRKVEGLRVCTRPITPANTAGLKQGLENGLPAVDPLHRPLSPTLSPEVQEECTLQRTKSIHRKKSLPRLLMDKLGYQKDDEDVLFDGELTSQRKRDSLKLKRGMH